MQTTLQGTEGYQAVEDRGRSSDGWRSKKIQQTGDAMPKSSPMIGLKTKCNVNISAESQSLDGIWLCILSLPYKVVCQHLTASSITPLSILFAASHAEGDCSTQARGPGVILDFQMHNQTGWQVLTSIDKVGKTKVIRRIFQAKLTRHFVFGSRWAQISTLPESRQWKWAATAAPRVLEEFAVFFLFETSKQYPKNNRDAWITWFGSIDFFFR